MGFITRLRTFQNLSYKPIFAKLNLADSLIEKEIILRQSSNTEKIGPHLKSAIPGFEH